MSQHQKILDLLNDNNWHCTSEMRALFMADPPKRLQELGDKVVCGGKCTKHQHGGGVKMWKLNHIDQEVKMVVEKPTLKPMTDKIREWNEQFERKQQPVTNTLF